MATAAANRDSESAGSTNPQGQPEGKATRPDFLGIILLGLVTLNVLALVGIGYSVRNLWMRLNDIQGAMQKMTVQEPQDDGPLGKELQPQSLGLLFPMESFLVNVASDQGPKFLQTQMELELSDPALEDEVSRKKAALRDAIIVMLSSRPYKELRAPNGLKKLRMDLVRAVNSNLSTGKVKEIYFTDFHFN
jgi:flagellar basal body-associated protein FliL